MFSPEVQRFDENLLTTIQKIRIRPLTWIMKLFTWTGKGRFWVFVAFTVNITNYFAVIWNPYFARAFWAPLLVWAINGLIKRKTKRDRPSCVNALVRQDGFSFPSSHSGSTFAFAFVLLWWQFPEAKYLFVWAAIVSFSRLYLGVHYLTDVIAGILVGLVASGMTYLIFL